MYVYVSTPTKKRPSSFKYAAQLQLHTHRLPTLGIDIAKRPRKRITSIPNSNRAAINPQIDQIIQRRIPTRRVIIQRDGSGDDILPVRDIEILPRPPGAIDHGVVKEEIGIAGRSEQITSWIPAVGEVARRVDA